MVERVRSSTKTRKSVATRQRIMDVASELMVERGNTVFRMSEVSQRCGMSKGALYYYFADKEDLLQAIFDKEIFELVASIDDAVEAADTGEAALRGACTAYASCVRKGGPLAMALVRELVISHDETSAKVDKNLTHIINTVARQLERAKDERVIRPDVNANLTAVAVCGAFAFTAMKVSGDAAGEDATNAEELFDIIVRGVGI